MSLHQYQRKRDFSRTREPGPDVAAPAGARAIFVVQLHHASRRHFDFRLQVGDVLKSWAVPNGPSYDPAVKRLAVEVEDHPLAYAGFEGDIEEGYGKGHVDRFDTGVWAAEGDPEAGLAKGHLTREIDALGGAMAHAADLAGIQWRTLNASKGPAVRATRCQADRALYKAAIRRIVDEQPNLELFQQAVDDLILERGRAVGVVTQMGLAFRARAVVLTAGTFLAGSVAICGLPPFNGFVSEWLIYLAAFRGLAFTRSAWSVLSLAALAMIGALAAACFAKVFGVPQMVALKARS